jgi:AraC-like DNA-binding protein
MLNDPVTISIAIVYSMLAGQRARGESCEALLTEAGIAPELLLQPDARVTASSFVNLMLLVIQRFNDESLGFLNRPLKPGSFSLMARAAQDAAILEQAIRHTAHTFRLLQDDATLKLQRDGDLAGMALHFNSAEVAQVPFLHELLLRGFWRLFAWLVGGKLPVVRFDFALPAPRHIDSYSKIFPAALRFEQPSSAFWFDAAKLQCPVRRDDAALHSFLTEAVSNIIVPRRTDEIVSERVRRHLQNTQPEWPNLAITASALCMSTATLQRHLANEGTSFQTLKDELRRDMAIVRLNTSTVQLAALAQELGFTDSAAFQRAFKSWTGSAPGAYRRGGF